MMTSKTLSSQPQSFLALTGLTNAEFGKLLPAFQGAYQCWSKLRFASPALDALLRDLPKGTTLLPASDDTSSERTKGLSLCDQLELRHISYCYPGASSPALHDVSLTIPACREPHGSPICMTS